MSKDFTEKVEGVLVNQGEVLSDLTDKIANSFKDSLARKTLAILFREGSISLDRLQEEIMGLREYFVMPPNQDLDTLIMNRVISPLEKAELIELHGGIIEITAFGRNLILTLCVQVLNLPQPQE